MPTIQSDQQAAADRLRTMQAEGYNHVCVNCRIVYQEKPTQEYADGHGGRLLNMCRCGSDLFITIDEQIAILQGKQNAR